MVADQDAHIQELFSRGDLKLAKFHLAFTWVLLAWYGVMHVVSGVSRAIKGKLVG